MGERREDRTSVERLFEETVDPVLVLDPQRDTIVDANPAACGMLEYTREELLSLPIRELHPAECRWFEHFLDTARADGTTWTIVMTCRTKSGRFLPTEFALFLLDTGVRSYLIGLLRDRSEHRAR